MGISAKMSKMDYIEYEEYVKNRRNLVKERIKELESRFLIVKWGRIFSGSSGDVDIAVECRHGESVVLCSEKSKIVSSGYRRYYGEDCFVEKYAYTDIKLNEKLMFSGIQENQEECFVCGKSVYEKDTEYWSVLGER